MNKAGHFLLLSSLPHSEGQIMSRQISNIILESDESYK